MVVQKEDGTRNQVRPHPAGSVGEDYSVGAQGSPETDRCYHQARWIPFIEVKPPRLNQDPFAPEEPPNERTRMPDDSCAGESRDILEGDGNRIGNAIGETSEA